MASPLPPPPAAPFSLLLLLLLLLVSLALAAAQQQFQPPPPPPPGNQVNNPDDAALRKVFEQWNLSLPANPCGETVVEPFPKNAPITINCNCSNLTTNEWCRVTHLNVTGYRNITFIPVHLFNLTELVSLDLSNNNLTGRIPPQVSNLSKLETWHFNNNRFNGSFPNTSALLRLQSLWMFDNAIEGMVPGFIANFTNLTDLRMYGMKLQGPIPENFSKLLNIENLMIGDLGGEHFPFNFIGDWANLSTLSLRNCGLTGKLPNQTLNKLTYLDLRSNNLPGPIEQVFQQYNGSLKYLELGSACKFKLKPLVHVDQVKNNFSGSLPFDNGSLPFEMPPSLVALDVTYNPLLSGSLRNSSADRKRLINYIGTLIDPRSSVGSEDLSLLNCLDMKACKPKALTNRVPFAVNCGGEQYTPLDPFQTMFNDDSTDLGAAGFHVNTSNNWVVSHVGADPFSNSTGIVNASKDISGTDMPDLYRTARTSTGSLWYYVVGLASRTYTVQLFFAEIVIESESGRRLFNIDIQGQNIRKDFNIFEEAGGFNKATSITHVENVTSSVLKIHLYWNGRGTCCIPRNGTYGPLVSAIRVFPYTEAQAGPPPAPHTSRRNEKRRGVVAGIVAFSIAAVVISSSVVYLWWKWVSLVKHPKA